MFNLKLNFVTITLFLSLLLIVKGSKINHTEKRGSTSYNYGPLNQPNFNKRSETGLREKRGSTSYNYGPLNQPNFNKRSETGLREKRGSTSYNYGQINQPFTKNPFVNAIFVNQPSDLGTEKAVYQPSNSAIAMFVNQPSNLGPAISKSDTATTMVSLNMKNTLDSNPNTKDVIFDTKDVIVTHGALNNANFNKRSETGLRANDGLNKSFFDKRSVKMTNRPVLGLRKKRCYINQPKGNVRNPNNCIINW